MTVEISVCWQSAADSTISAVRNLRKSKFGFIHWLQSALWALTHQCCSKRWWRHVQLWSLLRTLVTFVFWSKEFY